MKILIISPVKNDGTSYYRCWGVFNKMAKMFSDVELIEGIGMVIDWQTLGRVDLVFMQRPFTNDNKNIADMCVKHRVPYIIDYDDDLFVVGDHNRAYPLYSNKHIQGNIERLCKNASQIWTATDQLKSVLKKFNPETYTMKNAVDFDMIPPTTGNRSKTIAYRGGDSHEKDLMAYKKEIFQLVEDLPDYTFHFFGYCPPFIRDHISGQRLKHHRFNSPIVYMKNLIELRPKVLIVPLEDTEFNKSKSDISLIEGSTAGAQCVTPYFIDSFMKDLVSYQDPKSFYDKVIKAVKFDGVTEVEQLGYIKDRSLEIWVEKRFNAIYKIILEYDQMVQIVPIEDVKPVTEYQAYYHSYGEQTNIHNTDYNEGIAEMIQPWIDDYKIESVLDIGCGPGVFVAEFLKKGIEAIGVDINEYWMLDFDEQYPEYEKSFLLEDFSDTDLGESIFDLVLCIEVMEHLDDETIVKWIQKIQKNCKYLIFTSVPFGEGANWDKYWGHINLKSEAHWISIFHRHGFKLLKKKHLPAPEWGMLFINANI